MQRKVQDLLFLDHASHLRVVRVDDGKGPRNLYHNVHLTRIQSEVHSGYLGDLQGEVHRHLGFEAIHRIPEMLRDAVFVEGLTLTVHQVERIVELWNRTRELAAPLKSPWVMARGGYRHEVRSLEIVDEALVMSVRIAPGLVPG